uniref:Reverse transcriptase domain-containing protein n=1 Tax=Tanacetum cinerariifolium TaxID=118510 RepID=A0A6L2MI54_TANCI|nr:reverse transcriptase domain-containing protein [Tanacetum cinerariifolium]
MHNPSGSGSLPNRTVANPRGDVKAITTRSGVAYEGPSLLPTSSSLLKEVEREPKVTREKVQTTSSESTTHVQPLVVQVPILEPDVASKPNPKPSIPYPSRLNDQKLCKKTNNQMLKFLQIIQILHFDISFTDALLHILKFASTFKSLLSNKGNLFELASTSLNENCSESQKECLALTDLGASINLMPLSVWKNIALGTYSYTHDSQARKPIVDHDVNPRVPLILGRHFLRMTRALINVHDVACEEYAQEVLGFSDSLTSGNPTPSVPIIASSSPSFTPFKGGYFILEEIETFLRTPDELSKLDDDYYDTEGDILYLEKLLNKDLSLNLPPIKNEDLKKADVTMTKPLIEEPLELKLKDLPSHLEYAFLEGTDKLPVIISKELKDEEKVTLLKIPIDPQDQENTTFTCLYGTFTYRRMPFGLYNASGMFQSFLGHAGFYRRFIQDFSKIARPITHPLEKETQFIFSKECIQAFNPLKKKLTEAPILVAPDWDLPLETMCDTSDFAVGAVLGQRKTKHFQPIHYASKTVTDAQAHYITMKKELLAVVYAFEKLWPCLVLSKTIVYTNHSALKYLLSKQDAKPRLLQWILLLQEFDVIIHDKKRAENLTADHLSRLENPHQGDL